MTGMKKIDSKELKRLQKKYGFSLCRVKGTEMVQICKHKSRRFEEISFEEFTEALKKRRLAVFKGQGDFLKIMRNK